MVKSDLEADMLESYNEKSTNGGLPGVQRVKRRSVIRIKFSRRRVNEFPLHSATSAVKRLMGLRRILCYSVKSVGSEGVKTIVGTSPHVCEI